MRRMRRSLGAKLLAAQLLVIAAGAWTLFLVAVSVGPIFFRRHVRDALGIVPPDLLGCRDPGGAVSEDDVTHEMPLRCSRPHIAIHL